MELETKGEHIKISIYDTIEHESMLLPIRISAVGHIPESMVSETFLLAHILLGNKLKSHNRQFE
ncbi:MAG: hypothetical protein ACJA1A_001481 [Saprospiraceae bacterium]|jgi:hypothetical protein|tara:strand:+ start:1343 stop:1534 length:192 start_codon:yes stop_codon:yes gene_type:complete